MTRFQPIYDIAALCARKGLKHAILCPGSRCAPLTLAFTRHPDINCKTISDERSAAFMALGISQATRVPAVLICTSGTAAYNFAPAVAEAYFSKTPLVVITADRPTEWIGQQDGQTIYQTDLFGKHVKAFYQLPQEYEHADNYWAINRMVNEALNAAVEGVGGPVHINAPFREPLYPQREDAFSFQSDIRVIEEKQPSLEIKDADKNDLAVAWQAFHNVLIVAGQHTPDINLVTALEKFLSQHNIPIIGDIISNLHPIESLVRHSDLFLGQCPQEVLKTLGPDLLITFGDSTISKNLKLFLRKYPPTQHWHIQPSGNVADTFQSVTKIIRTTPALFFSFLSSLNAVEAFGNQKQNNYHKLWEVEERRTIRALEEHFAPKELGELDVVHEVIQSLPSDCRLHLANSMSVRYANFVGLTAAQRNVRVYSNRGTSGIDGCTSTAVGHAFADETINVLLTGDQAFFYDRNAFWHNYPLKNLRVVLLNNHGGIIFKLIDGPSDVPEANEYFITNQRLNAKHLCDEFGIEYIKIDNRRKLKNAIKDFFDLDATPKVLEFESDLQQNKLIFENLKQKIRQGYEL